MKRKITWVLAIISWFAIIGQYVLMMEERVTTVVETTIRFVSFFTILTNTLIALYFTALLLQKGILHRFFGRPGILTALTSYIIIVGLVYQVVLRSLWTPTGLQMVVNELLHSVIPVEVVLYWYVYEYKKELQFGMIRNWMIYPSIYLIYTLVRGHYVNYYPYPFVNVSELGMAMVLYNSALLMVVFVFFSFVMIAVGKRIAKQQRV